MNEKLFFGRAFFLSTIFLRVKGQGLKVKSEFWVKGQGLKVN